LAKTKIQVRTREIVRDIRSGLDDAAIMTKYGLSAHGLDRLFYKLIAAGEIRQSELDRRLLSSQRSHVVELICAEEPKLPKARVRAADAVKAIRSGMSDPELMERFGLSAKGLASLFARMVDAGQIEASELESRRQSFRWADRAYGAAGDDSGDLLQEPPPSEQAAPGRLRAFLRRRKVWLAAGGGALGGMLLVSCAVIAFLGVENVFPKMSRPAPTSEEIALSALRKQADEFIRILQGIAGDGGGHEDTRTAAAASDYENCLRNCDQSFAGKDDSARALLVNCRTECLATHSEHFKRIRRRYYGGAAGQ
jgi:uncharacterized protein (DUF433 family)